MVDDQHDLGPESGGAGLRARDMVSGRVRLRARVRTKS